ncbi:MAG: OmpA family protein [Candidatus Solibacter sp.]|nr:OmpA family protein [Candidatus Solibacter sp.]
MFVLLPDPEGKPAGIVVSNRAGTQDLNQPYQAVRVERSDVAPSAPFTLGQAETRRLFGAALEVLPLPEVFFTLHFDQNTDILTAESQAQFSAILNAIRERRSTAITITGHTDTTGTAQANYQLGLRRAERVVGVLTAQGVDASKLLVSSHGDADLLVNTGRGVAEARNRRVEVIVR